MEFPMGRPLKINRMHQTGYAVSRRTDDELTLLASNRGVPKQQMMRTLIELALPKLKAEHHAMTMHSPMNGTFPLNASWETHDAIRKRAEALGWSKSRAVEAAFRYAWEHIPKTWKVPLPADQRPRNEPRYMRLYRENMIRNRDDQLAKGALAEDCLTMLYEGATAPEARAMLLEVWKDHAPLAYATFTLASSGTAGHAAPVSGVPDDIDARTDAEFAKLKAELGLA